MPRIPHLTAAEFEILKVLWRLDLATVAEVRAAQTQRGAAPAYTTVMTLLGRLATKGAVLVDRSREPFVYRAAHRRESVIGSRVRAFLQDVFDGKADSLVLHLVEDAALSVEELRSIERLITASASASSPASSTTSSTASIGVAGVSPPASSSNATSASPGHGAKGARARGRGGKAR
jgi:BlaI family transcriptional regulator, penicillinase repressor